MGLITSSRKLVGTGHCACQLAGRWEATGGLPYQPYAYLASKPLINECCDSLGTQISKSVFL